MNMWVALLAAVSSFVIGGLWYSPMLFGKAWNAENGSPAAPGHPGKVFGVSFVFSLAAAACFGYLAGPAPGLARAMELGVITGLGLVATSFGINYQFAQRTFRLWMIDGGYHVAQFLLFGLIFGLWG